MKASDTLESGQYLTHAHNHITRAVAVMDSCFGFVRPHQHGIAVGQKIGLKALCTLPFTAEAGARQRQVHRPHVVGTGQTMSWSCSIVSLAFIVFYKYISHDWDY